MNHENKQENGRIFFKLPSGIYILKLFNFDFDIAGNISSLILHDLLRHNVCLHNYRFCRQACLLDRKLQKTSGRKAKDNR